MKPIQVLSIGNSFSQDAHRYLHDLARHEGMAIETVNLFIGGCSLERHYQNMITGSREYTLEINGHRADGFFCSIDEALFARQWDVITLQQVSGLSIQKDSYDPYLKALAAHVRNRCPNAKLLLHQTWAYESGSDRIRNCGFNTYSEMFSCVKICYEEAAQQICADGIIPCGEAFHIAIEAGISNLHRDTFHASYGVGRFLLALVWYMYLTGNNASKTDYYPFDEPVAQAEYDQIMSIALQTLSGAKPL